MKTIKHLLWAILPMVALSLAGCSKGTDDNPGDKPGGKVDSDFDLKIELAKANETSLEILCTPSDDKTPYLVFAIAKSEYKNDAEMISSNLSTLQFEARLDGKKFSDYIAALQHRGTTTVAIDNLTANTKYYVFAYANDSEGNVVGEDIFMREVSTAAKAAFSIELAVDSDSITDSSAKITATPSDAAETYFVNCMEAANYEAAGGDTQIASMWVAYIKQQYSGQYSKFITKGNLSSSLSNLTPNTKYVLFAFGMDSNGNITSKLSRLDFTTKEFVATDDCTFTLSASNIQATTMTLNVTPSSQTTRYYIGLVTAEAAANYTKDGLAAEFISMEEEYDIDWATSPYVFTGAKSLDVIDDLSYKPLTASTEYTFVIFGIDTTGKRTTTVTTFNATTAAPAQSDMTLDMAATDITMNGATVTVTPSSQTEEYFANIMPYDTYKTATNDDEIISSIVEQLGSNMSSYLASGTTKFNYEYQLVSNTKYVAYAFGYAGGATTKLFTYEFTTSEAPAGVIDAAVGVAYQVLDGGQINSQYAGRAVFYAILAPNANAASWSYIFTDDDVFAYDDATVVAALKTSENKDEKSFVAFAGDWNTTVYFAVVAFDKSGTAGVPQRYKIEVKQPATTSSVPSLSSVKRMLDVKNIKAQQLPALKTDNHRNASKALRSDKAKMQIMVK